MKTKKESDEPSLFDRRKRVFGRLFVRTARTIQERAIERIRSHGFDDYRLGDNAVLIHLEMKGNRISELAQRSGLSKQALSQLVADLERRGVVNKERDPADGRAMIVKYTEYGASLLTTGVDVVEEEDATIRQILGDERAEIVREALIELLDHLDPEGF